MTIIILTFFLQKSYGMTVPNWVDRVYSDMERVATFYPDPRVIVPNEEAKRVKAGPLLTSIVKNMDVRRNSAVLSESEKNAHRKSKFYMIYGHAVTIEVLLGTLDVFDTQLVPYGSTVILEMHKGNKDQGPENIEDHYVKVLKDELF